jgi:hypothetical protein
VDLMQLYWGDYNIRRYSDAIRYLGDAQAAGKIRHVGVTNFDTPRLQEMLDTGVPIVTNQVGLLGLLLLLGLRGLRGLEGAMGARAQACDPYVDMCVHDACILRGCCSSAACVCSLGQSAASM